MDSLVTAAQMRALEARAIAAGGVTGAALMERAAEAVVAAAVAEYDARETVWRDGRHAVVFCGPGNNGGDGFVIARLLAATGWTVDVHAAPTSADAPDAVAARAAWVARGRDGRISPLYGPDDVWIGSSTPFTLIIDAGFGTGLTRPIPPDLAATWWWHHRQASDRLCVAVDAPSGLCLDSGRVLGLGAPEPNGAGYRDAMDEKPWEWRVLPADLTVTFHAAKPGHFLADGPGFCGKLVVADIGLGAAPSRKAARLITAQTITKGLAKPAGRDLHKYDHGHVLVLAGGVARGGAARLAARAALRVGAGVVTLGCPPGALIAQVGRPDAIMLRAVAGAEDLVAWEGLGKVAAVCLGPGFGLGPATRAMVAAVCGLGRPVVLDADALGAFADDPAALFALTHPACVLTPHMGEFARLFPDLAARVAGVADRGPAWSKLDAARAAADRAGAVVLVKGADTVIAAPGGGAAIHAAAYDRAAPWLATAGAGDVLAGMIAGLLARGLAPQDAAGAAAWLHVAAARRFGPGLIADDLPEALPGVLRDLEA